MIGRGIASKSLPANEGGEIRILFIDDTYIEAKKATSNETKRIDDQFRFDFDPGLIKAKYLKTCYEIIKQNPGKSVIILSRTNYLYNIELEKFKNRLTNCLSNRPSQKGQAATHTLKDVLTVHRAKGLEADIAIVLQVCEGIFPLVHSDNELFEMFGQTIDKVMAEERRLFYVAITRPKEKLYLLTERARESKYLLEAMNVGLPQVVQRK